MDIQRDDLIGINLPDDPAKVRRFGDAWLDHMMADADAKLDRLVADDSAPHGLGLRRPDLSNTPGLTDEQVLADLMAARARLLG